MAEARYITTTLPYVNTDPHIGFGLEILEADALARYWRLMGHEVFFNTGTDEHGQKIAEKSKEEGRDVKEYVDYFAGEFRKLKDALNLSCDAFIRTTDAAHEKAAQELWRRCLQKGDIYKKKYRGLYCVGDEMFLRESDLVDGRCPNHPNMEPIEIEEENYFFALSKYQSQLLDYLKKKDSVVPKWRREEAVQFVEAGLEDLSISRDASRLTWGIPVPEDDSQVMYVWFDALTNYISTLGWPSEDGNFKKFWEGGKTLQMAGKDQIRFQSIIWQAMLFSADIKPTDTVFYHGFITSKGQKMSKSLGNVISPYELVEHYGTEATRYLLLRHVHPFEDTDVTWERLDEWYTAHLVNGIGNLVARVMKMAEDNLDGPVTVTDAPLEKAFTEKLEAYRFDEAFDLIFEHIAKGDAYIQETQPFKMVKSDNSDEVAKAKQIIEKLVGHIYRIAEHLVPFMPETAAAIQQAVKVHKKPENLFVRLKQ